MQSTEGGRKLNQAVNTTSKAVGGAITQAKGAFSNWWSSMTTQQQQQQPQSAGDPDRIEEGEEVVDGRPAKKDPQEIGTPAEEFLESEVETARQEVPREHQVGDVFTA